MFFMFCCHFSSSFVNPREIEQFGNYTSVGFENGYILIYLRKSGFFSYNCAGHFHQIKARLGQMKWARLVKPCF